MDDQLIDDGEISLQRRSLLPGKGFFVPDSFDDAATEKEAKETIEGSNRLVIADPDADGLGCVALIRVAFDTASLLPAGPHELSEALEYVAEYGEDGLELFVCDLCPDSTDDLAALPSVAELAESVWWFDHHQWDEELHSTVSRYAELVVGDSDSVCTTDVALETIEYEFEDRYVELAAVTRDHDLWLREDSRSDDLADYAYWIEPEEYIDTVVEYGANLPEEVEAFLEEQRVEKEALIAKANDRAEYETIGELTVGVTYGRCSQNEVAEAMREQGADASVIVKPAGSASIRGTDGFQRCHEVAGRVNGGGHPKAAGCKPDIYDDMLDYAHHWTTQGAITKQVILDAFRAVVDDTESAGVDGAESTGADDTESAGVDGAESTGADDTESAG